MLSQFLGATNTLLNTVTETAHVPDDAQTHVVLVQALYFTVERPDKQLHQRSDFLSRTAPVFTAEGVERQRFKIIADGEADGAAHRFYARFMAGNTQFSLIFSPTTIAIHNDSHVTWARSLLVIGFVVIIGRHNA